MTISRIDNALLLTGESVDALRWVLNVAIAARYRAGKHVPPEVGQLAGAVTGNGHNHTRTTQSGNDRSVIGVDELAQLTGLSRRQARRVAATLGKLARGRWVIDTDTADDYVRTRTA